MILTASLLGLTLLGLGFWIDRPAWVALVGVCLPLVAFVGAALPTRPARSRA